MQRNYLLDKNKEKLNWCTDIFKKLMSDFQANLVTYVSYISNLNQTGAKNPVTLKLESDLKTRTDFIFKTGVENVKANNLKPLGKVSQSSQTFIFPYSNTFILKFDFSKGYVRTLHVYDIQKKICYSLSQSVDKITMSQTEYQNIIGIIDMDDNWRV